MTERLEAGGGSANAEVDSFWSLVQPYDRGLRALAYRLVRDRNLMDDVLQETYLKAFRAFDSLRGKESLGPWLYRIAYNASMDQLRRRNRLRQVPGDELADRPDPAPDPADVASGRRDLAAALQALPPDMRAPVLLVDAEGMSYEEAAAVIGVAPGTIGSRLSRARAILRRALGATTEGRDEP
jgi:RNA polymerase sigma-70 factor, ECF subfamily